MQDERSALERWIEQALGDADAKGFGSGWMSGTASVFLGFLAILGVLGFRFPDLLSSPELRARYSLPLLRALLETAIALGFVLGAVSVLLRQRKVLGGVGVALAMLAALLGGGSVEVQGDFARSYTLGLDWFVLNLLLLALVFVPLERAFPHLARQTSFRFGWATDGTHFLVSHLALQILTFLTLLPAATLVSLWRPATAQGAIASQPVWLQLVEIVALTDLVQYWVHRAFHQVPFLWRFHAIHHSSRAMDWLAGSRLHVLDVIVTRGLVVLPVFLFGFSQTAIYAYLVFVGFHAVFIHANLGLDLAWLERWIATPRAHHWHHAVKPTDRNFAVHLPVLDRIFRTLHLPDKAWPEAYGIAGHPVPEGWLAQLVAPLRGRGGHAGTALTFVVLLASPCVAADDVMRPATDVRVEETKSYWTSIGIDVMADATGNPDTRDGLFVISGTLKNVSAMPVRAVMLEFSLLAADGRVLHRAESFNRAAEALLDVENGMATVSTRTDIPPIAPGATDTYRMIFIGQEIPIFDRAAVAVKAVR